MLYVIKALGIGHEGEGKLFQQHINTQWDFIPEPIFASHRPTVGALLINQHGRGILLVHHADAPAHTYIPPQGGINRNESPGTALLREAREELGGIVIDTQSIQFLGDCVNEMSGRRNNEKDKWFFWLTARYLQAPSSIKNEEIDDVTFAWGPEHLHGLFESGDIRRRKRDMIVEAIDHAHRLQLLSWRYEVPEAAVDESVTSRRFATA